MVERLSNISSKIVWKHKKCIFACFWAYVGQPHDHIGWATSMPFASINPTNPRTNPWNFWKKILRIGRIENLGFFQSAILNIFFKIFFYFIPMKISHKLNDGKNGTHFWCFHWFPAKSLLCVILRYTVYNLIDRLSGSCNFVK
jgi:hypothetical protein